MKNRKLVYFLLTMFLMTVIVLAGVLFFIKAKNLKVIFFNVGQGDSILISRGSNQILIDGGKNGKILLDKLGKFVPFWDRQIETVLITHPDFDHIGGLAEAFKNYEINTVIKTEAQSSSQAFVLLKDLIKKEKAIELEGRSGLKIFLAKDTELDIIFPQEKILPNEKDSNSSSIVAKLQFGENKFLFTGDLPSEKEKEILLKNLDLEAQFLKVAHHGSKYSSSKNFLEKVLPKKAIISVGKNSYGHPSEEVLGRLNEIGSEIIRTDQFGDVIYFCQNVNSKCELQK